MSFTTSSNYLRKLELEASFSPNSGSKVLKSVSRSINDTIGHDFFFSFQIVIFSFLFSLSNIFCFYLSA